jgi:hypothetical protein
LETREKEKGMSTTMTEPHKGLSTEGFDSLITKAIALTHKIHAVDKAKTQYPKGSAKRAEVEADAQKLRDDRDIIVRELKRRSGEE